MPNGLFGSQEVRPMDDGGHVSNDSLESYFNWVLVVLVVPVLVVNFVCFLIRKGSEVISPYVLDLAP